MQAVHMKSWSLKIFGAGGAVATAAVPHLMYHLRLRLAESQDPTRAVLVKSHGRRRCSCMPLAISNSATPKLEENGAEDVLPFRTPVCRQRCGITVPLL